MKAKAIRFSFPLGMVPEDLLTLALFVSSVFQCCCALYSYPLSCDTVPLCPHMLWNSDQNLCQVKQLMSQDKRAYQKQLNHFLIG